MKASRINARLPAFLACAAVLAMAAAAHASGDGHAVAGCDTKQTGSGPTGDTGATGRACTPQEIEELGADGACGPGDAQSESGPEGDDDANGKHGVMGDAGPSRIQEGPRCHDKAPGAEGESGHARAPPAVVPAPRIGPGA